MILPTLDCMKCLLYDYNTWEEKYVHAPNPDDCETLYLYNTLS